LHTYRTNIRFLGKPAHITNFRSKFMLCQIPPFDKYLQKVTGRQFFYLKNFCRVHTPFCQTSQKQRNAILLKEEMYIKTKFYGNQSDIDRRRRRNLNNPYIITVPNCYAYYLKRIL
jgi:hypothetical protein